jgi:nucleotide-binding universal stress UspA family protein
MAALFVASDLAEHLGSELRVVHAIELRDYPIDPDSPDWEEHGELVLAHVQLAVEEVMSEAVIEWRYRTYRMDPVSALLLEAEHSHASMIVVGSRGEGVHTSVERLVSRSVSHRLINRSPCPVLVVGPGIRGIGEEPDLSP